MKPRPAPQVYDGRRPRCRIEVTEHDRWLGHVPYNLDEFSQLPVSFLLIPSIDRWKRVNRYDLHLSRWRLEPCVEAGNLMAVLLHFEVAWVPRPQSDAGVIIAGSSHTMRVGSIKRRQRVQPALVGLNRYNDVRSFATNEFEQRATLFIPPVNVREQYA